MSSDYKPVGSYAQLRVRAGDSLLEELLYPKDSDEKVKDAKCGTCGGEGKVWMLNGERYSEKVPGAKQVECPMCDGTGKQL